MRILLAALFLMICACSSSKKSVSKDPETPAAETTAKSDKSSPVKTESSTPKAPKAITTGQPTEGVATVTCVFGEVKRQIRVENANEKCRVEYVKEGQAQEIATGAMFSSFCNEIADRVKNNLTSAGYQCE
jgi:hypothetical protein